LALLNVLAGFAYKDGKLGIAQLVLLVLLSVLVVAVSWAARSFKQREERLLDEEGRCAEGTILEVDLAATERDAETYVLHFSFTTGEPGDHRTRNGKLRVEPEYLLAQGLDPRPGMLVGSRVRVRYVPRAPWVFRLEGLVLGEPDLGAEPGNRTSC